VIGRRLDIRGSYKHSVSKQCDGGGERRAASPQVKTRTEIVYEYCSAFNKREHRVLLQLHILRDLVEGFFVEYRVNGCASTLPTVKRRTADFAMRVTSARGSSKFSMPSDTASC